MRALRSDNRLYQILECTATWSSWEINDFMSATSKGGGYLWYDPHRGRLCVLHSAELSLQVRHELTTKQHDLEANKICLAVLYENE